MIIASAALLLGVTAAVVEIGDNFKAVIVAIIGAVMLYLQNKARKEQAAAKDLAAEAKDVAAEAHKELKPNGGTSLRDAVDRIENKVDAVADRVTHLEESLPKDGAPPDGG